MPVQGEVLQGVGDRSWWLVLQQACVLPTGPHGCSFRPWACSRAADKQNFCREVVQLSDRAECEAAGPLLLRAAEDPLCIGER